MFQAFYPIRLSDLTDVDYVLTPEALRQPGSLHSPALEVMTDFEQVQPVQVSEGMQIDEALEHMKAQHVRLLFANDNRQQLSGIVSAADIVGDKPMAVMHKQGMSRDQVEVRHLMLARAQIRALTYEQVESAKIGDVMITLKGSGDQHVLVTDVSLAGVKRVRGIISASDISRYLRISFDVMYQAKSFSEIERVITRGQEF